MDRVHKTAGLSRVVGVFLLVLLTIGIGGYVIPRLAQLSNGEPVDWQIDWGAADTTTSSLEEQVILQQLYADALQHDIVNALEQVTGRGSVKATVLAELEWTKENINKQGLSDNMRIKENLHKMSSAVKKLSVSVLIDGQMVADKLGNLIYQPRSRSDMTRYTNLVKGMIGFNPARGDKLEVLNLPFTNRQPLFLGTPLSLWLNGFYFILFVAIVIGLMGRFVLPLLCHLVDTTETPLKPKSSHLLNQVEHLCRQDPEQAALVIHRALEHSPTKRSNRQYNPADLMAMVLLVLKRSTAQSVCRHLSGEYLRRIGRITERLGSVPATDIQIALKKFIHDFDTPTGLQGHPETAKTFLQEVHPDGNRLYSEMRLTEKGTTVWERLAQLEVGELISFLQRQKPETAALILCSLPDEKAGQVLTVLPSDKGARILVHLTHLKRIRPDMRDKLSAEIAPAVLDLLQHRQDTSGSDRIAAIMKTISEKERDRLIQGLSATEQSAVQHIRACFKKWDDILRLPDESILRLLKYCDKEVMAAALSDLPPDVRGTFARYMTPAEWQMIQQKITPANTARAEGARATILRTARELNLFG